MSFISPAFQTCLEENPTGLGPLSPQEYCEWATAAERPRYRPTPTRVSMGPRDLPVHFQGPSIFTVATPSPFPSQVGIHEQIDRRDEPLNQEGIPMNGAGQLVILGAGAAPNTTRVMKGKITYTILNEQVEAIRSRPFMSNEIPTASGPGPGTPAAGPVVIDEEDEPVSTIMDLATTLGSAYIDARYGQPQVQPAFNLPSPGLPFVDVIPEPGPSGSANCGTKGQVWDPNANCGQGKWIKRRKRRRQRLATSSDIKDIGALKSVLGPTALNAWIATH